MTVQLDSYASSTYGKQAWDKTTQDVANYAENFATARDIGYLRYNYSRVNVVSSLGAGDSQDFYKFSAQSTGTLNLSIIEASKDQTSKSTNKGPLDIDVNDYLEAAGISTNDAISSSDEEASSIPKNMIEGGPLELDLNKYLHNAGIEIETTDINDSNNAEDTLSSGVEEQKSQLDDAISLSETRVQIYSYNGRKAELIADSGAEKDSDLYKAYENMRKGQYQITEKQDYYVRVSRPENQASTKESNYVMQLQIGDGTSYKHDYLTTEANYNPLTASRNNSTSSSNLITSLLNSDPSKYNGATSRILSSLKQSRSVASSLSLYNNISKLLRK